MFLNQIEISFNATEVHRIITTGSNGQDGLKLVVEYTHAEHVKVRYSQHLKLKGINSNRLKIQHLK